MEASGYLEARFRLIGEISEHFFLFEIADRLCDTLSGI